MGRNKFYAGLIFFLFFLKSPAYNTTSPQLASALQEPTGERLHALLSIKDSALLYLDSPEGRSKIHAFINRLPKNSENGFFIRLILGNHYVYHLHPDTSTAILTNCLKDAEMIFPQYIGRARFSLATTYALVQRNHEAISMYKQALQELQKVGDNQILLALYNNLGAAMERQGFFEESLNYQMKYLSMVDSIGDKALLVNGYMNLVEMSPHEIG